MRLASFLISLLLTISSGASAPLLSQGSRWADPWAWSCPSSFLLSRGVRHESVVVRSTDSWRCITVAPSS
ncbi:unnamed protein product [Haemonchus placei]|uniref:Secreted protein n=1 Tax=Haemonchus placei TaxID=6290 RepID=A0A3P8CAF2_HAEPC|nr:unnamed protein product [Haemonchus placei]